MHYRIKVMKYSEDNDEPKDFFESPLVENQLCFKEFT